MEMIAQLLHVNLQVELLEELGTETLFCKFEGYVQEVSFY